MNNNFVTFDNLKEMGLRHNLKLSYGNKLEVSKQMNLDRNTINSWVKKYQIDITDYKKSEINLIIKENKEASQSQLHSIIKLN